MHIRRDNDGRITGTRKKMYRRGFGRASPNLVSLTNRRRPALGRDWKKPLRLAVRPIGSLFRWLWDYESDLRYVGFNPFVEERYERLRKEELYGCSVTE